MSTNSQHPVEVRGHDQRGSVLPLVIAILFIFTATMTALARTSQVLVREARADNFADLVALATAASDRSVGESVADANGVVIDSVTRRPDGAVQVRISYRGSTASAAAREAG